MYDIPKWLNIKQDYLNIKKDFPPEKWQPRWRELYEDRTKWLNRGVLAEHDPGVEAKPEGGGVVVGGGKDDPVDPNKPIEGQTTVIVSSRPDEGTEERYQMEYAEDENCKLNRLGMTLVEVTAALEE